MLERNTGKNTASAVDDPPETVAGSDPHARAIGLWLYGVAALVFAMVVVGGATRLTESGLSITEWRPVMGTLPPLGPAQWQAEFEKYQVTPQYRELNRGMNLEQFKTIYWWEWTHRLLGRAIGVVFLLPLLFFLWRGFVEPGLRARLWLIFGLGALQGAIGWWMVASGLAERVEVSQYRLATHLLLAALIYVALVWTAQSCLFPCRRAVVPGRIRVSAIALMVLVLAQIYLGALVAGLRAGLIYNTWPLIDGSFVPETVRLFSAAPAWRNFFENTLTVQFDHRIVAYALLILAALHVAHTRRTAPRGVALQGALALLAALAIQAGLGILTLVYVVPLPLALLHQAGAMLVLTIAALHAQDMTREPTRFAFCPSVALPSR